jgi:hypothetical protein
MISKISRFTSRVVIGKRQRSRNLTDSIPYNTPRGKTRWQNSKVSNNQTAQNKDKIPLSHTKLSYSET